MKIPNVEHWAIITTSSYTVPGDERSRTNPGHGYPEHTVETIEYDAYTDYATFEAAVKKRTASLYNNRNFKAVHVKPLTIETNIVIKSV